MTLRRIAFAIPVLAPALVLCACGSGDSSVAGPSVWSSTAGPASSSVADNPLVERPMPVTSAVTPPSSTPAPLPVQPSSPAPGSPAPSSVAPASGAPAPAPTPAPGAGDFVGLLTGRGVTLAPGKDPIALAQEACTRFSQGQTMMDVEKWLGGQTGFDPDKQGFFLGAAVPTYCPQNLPKLG